jgi:hypothetical protein
MSRTVFTIMPRWEGGHDVLRDGAWVGSAMTQGHAYSLACRLAQEVAVVGEVALIATARMDGEIAAVEWVDPPAQESQHERLVVGAGVFSL